MALTALLFASQSTSAMSLLQAYRSALLHDPAFQSALHENEAGQEARAIGRANLLPSVALSYGRSRNDGERSIGGLPATPLHYASEVTTLSLRQPLFNIDAWQRWREGDVQANYSDARFAGSAQDLITRLSAAYLDALLAEKQLQLAIAQRDAFKENQSANQRRYEKGAGTRTDVLETRARHEVAQAIVAEAEDNLSNARDTLAVIVGADPGALDALSGELPDLPLTPATLSEWEALARTSNAEVNAKRHATEYAAHEVTRNDGGHLPRVELVASHSRNIADSVITFNQASTINSIGIQVSIPIYAGGSVNAQSRQAVARLESARADLDGSTQKALVEVRKQFHLIASGRLRIAALMQGEDSALQLVEATRKSVIGGQRINVDVLNAVQQLYTTRRDLAQARHGYLLAWLRLRAAAGTLGEQDLVQLGTQFRAVP